MRPRGFARGEKGTRNLDWGLRLTISPVPAFSRSHKRSQTFVCLSNIRDDMNDAKYIRAETVDFYIRVTRKTFYIC